MKNEIEAEATAGIYQYENRDQLDGLPPVCSFEVPEIVVLPAHKILREATTRPIVRPELKSAHRMQRLETICAEKHGLALAHTRAWASVKFMPAGNRLVASGGTHPHHALAFPRGFWCPPPNFKLRFGQQRAFRLKGGSWIDSLE
jgi:hypothetical protein